MKHPKPDNPGMLIPPIIFYILAFIVAIFIQQILPIDNSFFRRWIVKIAGTLLIAIAFLFLIKSVRQFIISKTTFEVNKPVSVLQTKGIYTATRNPMYVGMVFLYLGITCFIGNFWNIILLPVLFLFIQEYVIKREEKYLEREFGQEYMNYKNKVRRWL